MMFELPTTIAALETAALAEAPGKWMPQVESVPTPYDSSGNSLKEFANRVAKNIDQHRLSSLQNVAHLTILMDLWTSKATDLILSKDVVEAEEIIKKVEGLCNRSIEQAKKNIKYSGSDIRNTKVFKNYYGIVLSAFQKYKSINENIISVSAGKLIQISFLKECAKDIRGKGHITSAFDLYKNAISLVVKKNIEPRSVYTDEEFGVMFTFDIPISKENRRNRQFKRDLEERIHNAVADANPEAVGKVGITWITEEVA